MAITAIGFDYGGVLCGLPGSILTKSIVQAVGVDGQAYSEAYNNHYKKRNRGEATWEEFYTAVLHDLGKSDKFDEVMRIDEEFMANATVNEAVIKLVDQLRANGYKTGLLSNNGADVLDEIKQNEVITHFDVANISAITGLVKPEPEAFAYFANELGVALDELVFIDDSHKSLSTAEECGYTPILFESVEQLAAALTKLNLL